MRLGIVLLITTVAAFALNAALAFPDGAPWGAANPAVEQHCATCHFGTEPIYDSGFLRIEGLPSRPTGSATYRMLIVFDDASAVTAGFQLIAQAANDHAGVLTSPESNTEHLGPAIRSTAPKRNDDGITWQIEWQAPAELRSSISFYLAASAANDDGSPFGDTIHYHNYVLTIEAMD